MNTSNDLSLIKTDMTALTATFSGLGKATKGDYLQTFVRENKNSIEATPPSIFASLWHPTNSYWLDHARGTISLLESFAYQLSNKIHNALRFNLLNERDIFFLSGQLTTLSDSVKLAEHGFVQIKSSFSERDQKVFQASSDRLFTCINKMIGIWNKSLNEAVQEKKDESGKGDDFGFLDEDKSLSIVEPIVRRRDLSVLKSFLEKGKEDLEIGSRSSLDFLHNLQGVLIEMHLRKLCFEPNCAVVKLLKDLGEQIEASLFLRRKGNKGENDSSLSFFEDYWTLIKNDLIIIIPDEDLNCKRSFEPQKPAEPAPQEDNDVIFFIPNGVLNYKRDYEPQKPAELPPQEDNDIGNFFPNEVFRAAPQKNKEEFRWIEGFFDQFLKHFSIESLIMVLNADSFKSAIAEYLVNEAGELDQDPERVLEVIGKLKALDYDFKDFDEETGAISKLLQAFEERIIKLNSEKELDSIEIHEGLCLIKNYFYLNMHLDPNFLASEKAKELMRFWGRRLSHFPDQSVAATRKMISENCQKAVKDFENLVQANHEFILGLEEKFGLNQRMEWMMQTFPEEWKRIFPNLLGSDSMEKKEQARDFILSLEMINKMHRHWIDSLKFVDNAAKYGIDFRFDASNLRSFTGYITGSFYQTTGNWARALIPGRQSATEDFIDAHSKVVLRSLEEYITNLILLIYAEKKENVPQKKTTNASQLMPLIAQWYQLGFDSHNEKAIASLLKFG